jgi:effector-binding domain-containing protein
MHNKRELKRVINEICKNLSAECMAASIGAGKATSDSTDAIVSSIFIINRDYVSRVSHPEPGMEQKAYYRGLIESFRKQITEIVDQISNLN